MNISQILPVAIPAAQVWVRSQRKRHRFGDRTRRLTDGERAVLSPFFGPNILEKVRIVEVLAIPNPWFYPFLRRLGIEPPLDMSHAGAITLDDTIVIARNGREIIRDWYPLLFHELVHVVQCTILGLDPYHWPLSSRLGCCRDGLLSEFLRT